MPNTPALDRFHKLIDDISRLYIKARNMQVQFGWETGRRLVEEEQMDRCAPRMDQRSSIEFQRS